MKLTLSILLSALAAAIVILRTEYQLWRLMTSPYMRVEKRIDLYLRELTTPPLKGNG